MGDGGGAVARRAAEVLAVEIAELPGPVEAAGPGDVVHFRAFFEKQGAGALEPQLHEILADRSSDATAEAPREISRARAHFSCERVEGWWLIQCLYEDGLRSMDEIVEMVSILVYRRHDQVTSVLDVHSPNGR